MDKHSTTHANPLAIVIDDLLELTVIGSFSRIGPSVRSRLFHWADTTPS